jgi:hypothetical protein
MKLNFNKNVKLKLFIVLLPLLISCDYIVNLKRTGDIITRNEVWNGASKIEIWAPVRLIPVISDTSKIEIKGMDFIVDDYLLIQSDDKLVVEHKNVSRIQESKIADLFLYAPNFESIIINSPCKFYCTDTLNINNLYIAINGAGVNSSVDIMLKGNNLTFCAYGMSKVIVNFAGQIHSANYRIEGGAIVNAQELFTEKTKIVHKSYGNSYIAASETLDVKIYATGNVYYTGNPQIIPEIIENNLFKATGKILPAKE